MATIAFYVFVYTLLLKRRTSQNVVWGGAAGCMPVMIGWSAVTGTIGWPALVMFAIIFFWTPPHTWALAMRYKDDYKAAGVPMLPAVATERQVTKQILIYTWLTVLATLALALATGWLYAAVAVVAGVWFLAMAHQLYAGVRAGEPVKPLRLFLQSNNYLAVVFCALAVDSAIGLPTCSDDHSPHGPRWHGSACCAKVASNGRVPAPCFPRGRGSVRSRSGQQHDRAGRLAALQVLVGAGRFGQRIAPADLDVDVAAGDRVEQFLCAPAEFLARCG